MPVLFVHGATFSSRPYDISAMMGVELVADSCRCRAVRPMRRWISVGYCASKPDDFPQDGQALCHKACAIARYSANARSTGFQPSRRGAMSVWSAGHGPVSQPRAITHFSRQALEKLAKLVLTRPSFAEHNANGLYVLAPSPTDPSRLNTFSTHCAARRNLPSTRIPLTPQCQKGAERLAGSEALSCRPSSGRSLAE